jgi:hypothetical protein
MTIDSYKHKVFSVAVATMAAYFGFQALDLALDLYQKQTYFFLAWCVFAFHVFWLLFIFDLHMKGSGHLARARAQFQGARALWHAFRSRVHHFYHWTYVKHYLNYLILPSAFYWSVILLMWLNPFFQLFKDIVIITATAGLAVTYWHFKEAFSNNMEHRHLGLKVLSLAKLLAAYLTYTAAVAVGAYYDVTKSKLASVVFVVAFLLVYQGLHQRKLLKDGAYSAMLVFAAVVSIVFTWVFVGWNYNYYTAGLLVLAVHTTCWEILYNYLEGALSRKLFWEYVFMLVVMVSFILSTHDFSGRV